MEISFYLSGPYVFADIRYGKETYAPEDEVARVRVGVGVKVDPANFHAGMLDKKKEPEGGKKALQLSKVETAALAIGREYELKGEPLPVTTFKELLTGKIRKKKKPAVKTAALDMAHYFEKAKKSHPEWSTGHVKSLTTWHKIFGQYNEKLTPAKITPELLEDFREWLHKDRTIRDNSVIKGYTYVKTILKAAGLPSEWVVGKASAEEDMIEPHTWEEVSAIWNLDLAGVRLVRNAKTEELTPLLVDKKKPNKLGLIRDRYVFVCLQGPRFSDTILLESVNIATQEIEGQEVEVLRYRQKKTKGWATVALHPIALEIIKRHQKDLKQLFPKVDISLVNRNIKLIGKLAGLNREVQRVYYRNGKRVVEAGPLWHYMTSHFARATWATNLLEAGMDITQVQKAGGWKSINTVLKYARVRQKNLHQATIAAWDKFKI